MPTYLCHGFRWHRPSIRVFVIVQNLDDASPDWIVRPATVQSLIGSFYNLFDFLPPPRQDGRDGAGARGARNTSSQPPPPTRVTDKKRARSKSKSRRDKDRSGLPGIGGEKGDDDVPPPGVVRGGAFCSGTDVYAATGADTDTDAVLGRQAGLPVLLLEEYDPRQLDEVSRPHAYVADYVARVDLSVSVVDEMARYERLLRQQQQQKHRLKKRGADDLPAMTGSAADEGSAEGHSTAAAGGDGAIPPFKKKSGGGGGGGGGGWLERLRDQLQRGEPIRWYLVVNNDEERAWAEEEASDEEQAAPLQQQPQPQPRRTPAFVVRDVEDSSAANNSDEGAFYDAEEGNGHGHDTAAADEAARERDRRRLRYELTGDANILRDDFAAAAAPSSSSSTTMRTPDDQQMVDTRVGERSSTTADRRSRLQQPQPPPVPQRFEAQPQPQPPRFRPPPGPHVFTPPPTLRPKTPSGRSGGNPPPPPPAPPPKTPTGRSGGGGLRRLFGRSKAEAT